MVFKLFCKWVTVQLKNAAGQVLVPTDRLDKSKEIRNSKVK